MAGRTARLVGSWIALGAFVAALVLPLTLTDHTIWDEDVFGPGVTGGDRAFATLESGREAVAKEHCAVCHWLRSVSRASAGLATLTSVQIDATLAPESGPTVWPDRLVVTHRPSRAPPAIS